MIISEPEGCEATAVRGMKLTTLTLSILICFLFFGKARNDCLISFHYSNKQLYITAFKRAIFREFSLLIVL